MTIKNNFQHMQGGKPVKQLTFKGKTMDVEDWARIRGLKKCTIFDRLHRNEPIENVLYIGNLRKFKLEQIKEGKK